MVFDQGWSLKRGTTVLQLYVYMSFSRADFVKQFSEIVHFVIKIMKLGTCGF